MITVVHSPANEQLRIDEVYLFVSVDEAGEGVCAAPLMGEGSLVPLMAADKKRVEALKPWAREVARITGKKIKLIKFTTRSEVMEIEP
ncbi:hypothetical protein ACVMGC_000996 [Bradyrhizobium barranii subsp. barranii]|uniref:hypothetical protein n=1 Tax=Bradyrhizobium TaxID=374 RepID=UPI001BA6CDE7|nr:MULTISPECIES: hypothetical protein [Bradyrhizobium]MBR0879598.1 hypothetical protein [Bradyrhizobium liaoningense]MCP1778850.1 hypothetical protein [Bradyrhizobium japonicum]MCP1958152.1 hypothetical protein [Bradyrhizobium japonicum]